MVVRKRKLITEIESVEQLQSANQSLDSCILQVLDFRQRNILWENYNCSGAVFLGCIFENLSDEIIVRKQGALVFPYIDDVPYNPYRSKLYTWQELLDGYSADEDKSIDYQIYQHFVKEGRQHAHIKEALTQRIHDFAIDDALRDFLEYDDNGMTRKKGVGFMGGHGKRRTDEIYKTVAYTARLMTREGYLVISGGGPGIMEAANLGAYMSIHADEALDDAINVLSEAPLYTSSGFVEAAKRVLEKFPEGAESLAIPTWFYGHEPTNLFASQIAKYFSNSIREDGLMTICLYGVVFAPGSAGTTQEIFMDATQNHYGTIGYYSPMIFLSRKRYLKETFIFPLLQQLAWNTNYEKMLYITDSPQEVMQFIKDHPPMKKVVKRK